MIIKTQKKKIFARLFIITVTKKTIIQGFILTLTKIFNKTNNSLGNFCIYD